MNTPVTNPDAVSAEVYALNRINGYTFQEIHEMERYSTIPPGSLCSIAHGKIPNCHRPALGLPPLVKVPADMVRKTKRSATPDRRPRRAINLVNPVSAADTIRAHADPEYIARLAELLAT